MGGYFRGRVHNTLGAISFSVVINREHSLPALGNQNILEMDPSYSEPDYLDDGLIHDQDLPYDDEDDEKLDETFGDDLPVGKHLFLALSRLTENYLSFSL